MNESEHISANHTVRCGTKSVNAAKTLLIFCSGFLLTAIVYFIIKWIWNESYATVAAIITMLASMFFVNSLSKYTLTDYEYAIFKGEFKITKIMGRSRRKNYISFCSQDVLVLSPYSEENVSKLPVPWEVRKDASSRVNYENCWFAVVNTMGKNQLVIFEPTEEMLTVITSHLASSKILNRKEDEEA